MPRPAALQQNGGQTPSAWGGLQRRSLFGASVAQRSGKIAAAWLGAWKFLRSRRKSQACSMSSRSNFFAPTLNSIGMTHVGVTSTASTRRPSRGMSNSRWIQGAAVAEAKRCLPPFSPSASPSPSTSRKWWLAPF